MNKKLKDILIELWIAANREPIDVSGISYNIKQLDKAHDQIIELFKQQEVGREEIVKNMGNFIKTIYPKESENPYNMWIFKNKYFLKDLAQALKDKFIITRRGEYEYT